MRVCRWSLFSERKIHPTLSSHRKLLCRGAWEVDPNSSKQLMLPSPHISNKIEQLKTHLCICSTFMWKYKKSVYSPNAVLLEWFIVSSCVLIYKNEVNGLPVLYYGKRIHNYTHQETILMKNHLHLQINQVHKTALCKMLWAFFLENESSEKSKWVFETLLFLLTARSSIESWRELHNRQKGYWFKGKTITWPNDINNPTQPLH